MLGDRLFYRNRDEAGCDYIAGRPSGLRWGRCPQAPAQGLSALENPMLGDRLFYQHKDKAGYAYCVGRPLMLCCSAVLFGSSKCRRALAGRAGARPAPTGRGHCCVVFLSVGATLVVARPILGMHQRQSARRPTCETIGFATSRSPALTFLTKVLTERRRTNIILTLKPMTQRSKQRGTVPREPPAVGWRQQELCRMDCRGRGEKPLGPSMPRRGSAVKRKGACMCAAERAIFRQYGWHRRS